MRPGKTALTVLILLLALARLHAVRVVSLSPSITETIYKLGKGDELVGNTSFCNFPPAAEKVRKVGGFLDISLETIIELNPGIIFHYPEHRESIRNMGRFSKLVEVRHTSVHDLLESIRIIAEALEVSERGAALRAQITGRLGAVRDKTKDRGKKRMLMVIGRSSHASGNITIIGKGDFLNEVMAVAGGKNAYSGPIPYPSVSIESIIRMDPEVIIEFSFTGGSRDIRKKMELWKKYPHIRAVKVGNVHIISEDYWVRPGPRITAIAESMAEMLKKNQ